MAVYTYITEKKLKNFLSNYNIGTLKKFKGILEGIENTNYKIITNKNTYILTLFEKRVKKKQLPFFINLKKHLIKKNFLCPNPIANYNNIIINDLNGKSCVLISFLKGKKTNKVSSNQCKQIGSVLSSLHLKTRNFKEKRPNEMGYKKWNSLFKKCKLHNNKYKKAISIIENELIFLKKNWPKNLPLGIIHADVFQDNVFFIKNKFSGLIDFYFACNDYFAYDIALTVNAWCFDKKKFNKDRFMEMIKGYQKNRKLTIKEKKVFRILLRGASLRILLTRLHDKIFYLQEAYVKHKDPEEYLEILLFHQNKDISGMIE